jgi:phosphoribosyl-ATP pyrophosphohydrolase/phosphoribosyl-AMP cyclohydrolase
MIAADSLKWNEQGLIPAIAQDGQTGRVLMLAWMDRQALELTLSTGLCHYYSRSRQQLWKKGETSGHYQHVESVAADCDMDCLLVRVRQEGAACHTGSPSCFFNTLQGDEGLKADSRVLEQVYDIICDRRDHPVEGSYTNYLFAKGIDKMCKKVGEEAAEVIIAAKNRSPEEVRYEVADLMYHVSVLLAEQGVSWPEIFEELSHRHTHAKTEQ